MNRNLILITSHFPFGYGESFLEKEIHVLEKQFGKICIISRDVTSMQYQSTSRDTRIFRYNPSNNFIKNLCIPWVVVRYLKLFLAAMFFELSSLRNDLHNKFTFRVLKILIHDLVKSLELTQYIEKIIAREIPGRDLILYSYWFDSSALAVSMIKGRERSLVRISRTHRADLYAEESENKYLPFQKWKLLKLNKIFFISNHGKKYLEEKFKLALPNAHVARLGVDPAPHLVNGKQKQSFIIVSCSYIKKVKRIDLIIKSLKLIKEARIEWIHLGGGEMQSNMEELARQLLSGLTNIKYKFRGFLKQNEIIDFYSSNWVDLFINVSSSEGIPVSIMEAFSFGIPVLAANVGGVNEIVNDDNGILVNADSSPSTIADKIICMLNMSEEKRAKLRKSAFSMWKENYSASENFLEFTKLIIE